MGDNYAHQIPVGETSGEPDWARFARRAIIKLSADTSGENGTGGPALAQRGCGRHDQVHPGCGVRTGGVDYLPRRAAPRLLEHGLARLRGRAEACFALPCPALPCLGLPCPALPCLALPCPARTARLSSPQEIELGVARGGGRRRARIGPLRSRALPCRVFRRQTRTINTINTINTSGRPARRLRACTV